MGKRFSRPNRRCREETRTTAKYQKPLEQNERLSAAAVTANRDIEYKINLAPTTEIQQSVHTTKSEVDGDTSREHTTMLKCSDKLAISLSTDILHMAEVLLAKEFITEEIHSKMLLSSFYTTNEGLNPCFCRQKQNQHSSTSISRVDQDFLRGNINQGYI